MGPPPLSSPWDRCEPGFGIYSLQPILGLGAAASCDVSTVITRPLKPPYVGIAHREKEGPGHPTALLQAVLEPSEGLWGMGGGPKAHRAHTLHPQPAGNALLTHSVPNPPLYPGPGARTREEAPGAPQTPQPIYRRDRRDLTCAFQSSKCSDSKSRPCNIDESEIAAGARTRHCDIA